jgi:hypothetical protein
MGQISALGAAALRVASRWQSGIRKWMTGAAEGAAWLWQGLLVAVLVFASAALLGWKEFSAMVRGKRPRWLIWPIIGFSLGTIGLGAYDAWRPLMNAPAAERISALPPAGQEETKSAEGGGAINETAEENARMGRWKEAVAQALKDAAARERQGADGVGPAAIAENNQQHEEGADKAPNVKKEDAEAGKEFNPFAASPVADNRQVGEINRPANVIPFVKPEGTRFWQMRAQIRGRRHWRGMHYGWVGIFPFHLLRR